MKVGDKVRNKITGEIGTVHESTFGYSIHVFREKENTLFKTLGNSEESYSEEWEIVEEDE